MTPAERVVVEAAIRLMRAYYAPPVDHRTVGVEVSELAEAAAGLLAEREGPPPEVLELTWGEVVDGDQIYSTKTDRWYPVISTVLMPGGRKVRLQVKGLPKSLNPDADRPVKVKRSAMGKAVDMFASVLWSGQSSPTIPEAAGAAPGIEVDPAADPEASEPDA